MRGAFFTGIAWSIGLAVLLAVPLISQAQDLTFTPRIISTEGGLELDMVSQADEYTQNGDKRVLAGTFFREELNAAMQGYVYHPRFQLFMAKVGGDLNQAEVRGTTAAPPPTSALDYDLSTIFLPEHPYNLALYASHHEASAPASFSGQRGAATTRSAVFTYQSHPYALSLSYESASLDSGANRIDTDMYRANGSYNSESVSHSASGYHSDSRSSLDTQTVHDGYSYSNGLRFFDTMLNSRVSGDSSENHRPSAPDLTIDALAWTEDFITPLPWNFSANATFGYRDDHERTTEASGEPASIVFNRSSETAFNLTHHLYESLVTNFTTNHMSTTSSSGDITTRSDALTSTYSKAIPTGKFTAGVLFANASANRTGTPTILSEAHNIALLGSFMLSQQNIVESTILIRVKDPATGILTDMPASDYIVTRLGTGIQITIESVAPATMQADPAYVYAFVVSYTLEDQSKITTTSEGYSVRLDLLENLLSPYYNYSTSEQKVVSGSIAGISDLSTTEVAGISALTGHYSGNVEHQSFRSRLTPQDSWKTSAQYQSEVTRDVHYSLLVTSLVTRHFASDVAFGGTAYRERTLGTGAQISLNSVPNKLNTVFSASYSITHSLIDSENLSANSFVTWQIGLLSVSCGAQVGRTQSTFSTGKTTFLTQYYYAKLTRKLF